MIWQTIEHVLSEEQVIERIRDRLDESYILIEYADEMYDIDDSDTLAHCIYQQLTNSSFDTFTAEAIDALPDQAYQDLLDDALGDTDTLSSHLSIIDMLNGSVFTFQEALELLPYIGVEKCAPILDDYEQTAPLLTTFHTGEMNATQQAYNRLSEEQQVFLVRTAHALGKTMVVDSTRPFAQHQDQYRADNLRMQDPYGMNDILAYVKEMMDTPKDSLQL